MNELLNFYREWLGFAQFYQIILSSINGSKTEFIQNKSFLSGLELNTPSKYSEISTIDNDYRIDVPVWFGNKENAQHRILIFGLEPRDSNHHFNIERVNNRVFASPFGVDRWNISSSVPRKPQNRYYRVFQNLIEKENYFTVFSDIVKYYKVIDKNNLGGINDELARQNFFKNANESKAKLLEEIQLISPTHILTLGNDSLRVIKNLLPEHRDKIIGIRHPANGGEKRAKEQIEQLLTIPKRH